MRIRSSGKFAYREDLIDDVADRLGEITRSGAVDASGEFTRRMLPALRELAAWAEDLAEYREQRPVEVDAMDSPAVAANRRHGRSHP